MMTEQQSDPRRLLEGQRELGRKRWVSDDRYPGYVG